MKETQMIFGTRAVMEAIRSGREIEKIYGQAGLNNDLIEPHFGSETTKCPRPFILARNSRTRVPRTIRA